MVRKKRFPNWVGVFLGPQMSQYNRLYGEWDFIVLKGKGNLVYLALGTNTTIIMNENEIFTDSSNEDQVVDASKKDVWVACAINQRQSKFEMHGLGLEEGACSISLRVVYPSQSSSRSQVLQNATNHVKK